MVTEFQAESAENKEGRSRGVMLGIVAVLLFLTGLLSVAAFNFGKQEDRLPDKVATFQVGGAGRHTSDFVEYPQSPPVGGAHNPVWQNCGFYDEPIRNEHVVHSLEHGAVWITYSPNLPTKQIKLLRQMIDTQTHLLASPFPNLPAPVVASAWGKQTRLRSTKDPDLEEFIRAYQMGPQTPELGAPCSGGIGEPK